MSEATRDELLTEAIRALTAAARLTRPVLERDEAASEEAGRPVWKPSGRCEPADWAEFVTLALAGAAANVGGVESVLAGRPGSWEADGVRQLLTSTVGHEGQYLWEHRTEPVRVTLYVDEILVDVGGWKPYHEAQDELQRRYAAIGIPSVELGVARDWEEMQAAVAALPPATEEQERRADAVAELDDRLEEQRLADWRSYGEALADAVRAAAGRRPGLTVPVEVAVDVDTFRSDRDEPIWPTLEWDLVGEALAVVPLPGDGRSPLERLDGMPDDRG